MPKYYCDYCDVFLTHDSRTVRKTHNGGRKHKDNVRAYYQAWLEDQAQKLIDNYTKMYLQQKVDSAKMFLHHRFPQPNLAPMPMPYPPMPYSPAMPFQYPMPFPNPNAMPIPYQGPGFEDIRRQEMINFVKKEE
uniref:U1 small nuclear ribonucleoprotein C n=1 Tax=Acrobeloides nanus TaxID=290746 RepID=A0A914EME5_9BILA